jgi:hypothetical protein
LYIGWIGYRLDMGKKSSSVEFQWAFSISICYWTAIMVLS